MDSDGLWCLIQLSSRNKNNNNNSLWERVVEAGISNQSPQKNTYTFEGHPGGIASYMQTKQNPESGKGIKEKR